jgi:threonine/homoserine/homoserine lactone efflux protein
MDMSAMAAFWVVAFLLILAPGADWAFILGASSRGNAVPSAVSGLAAGYTVMTLVVAAGVGAVVAGSQSALTVITLLGATYLVWLGISTLRHPTGPLSGDEPVRTDRGTFVEGIGVSGLNPKGLLVFVAVLPQFTDPRSPWPAGAQIAVLGAVFTATCAAFYLVLGAIARRVLLARPTAAWATSRLSGAGMVVIGALLVLDRVLA